MKRQRKEVGLIDMGTFDQVCNKSISRSYERYKNILSIKCSSARLPDGPAKEEIRAALEDLAHRLIARAYLYAANRERVDEHVQQQQPKQKRRALPLKLVDLENAWTNLQMDADE